jgi:hypothetical protein
VSLFILHFHQGAGSALYLRRSGSFAKTLMELFPEVEFVESKFPKVPSMCRLHLTSFLNYAYNYFKGYFIQNYQNRRELFENFAKEHGFDPLNPSNWYSIPIDSVIAHKVIPCFPNFSSVNMIHK